MNEIVRGNMVFEEKMLPCYMPEGRRRYSRALLGAYLWRGVAILLLSLLTITIWTEFHDNIFGSAVIMCDVLEGFVTILMFVFAEDTYINGGLSSRPLMVHENGVLIPPLYLRQFAKEGAFIHREEIDHLLIKRPRSFNIPFNRKEGLIWHNSLVEFIVYLKNGKKIEIRKAPPETITEAVSIMKMMWGIRAIDSGFGGGQRVVFKGGKVVDRVDL